MCYFGIAIFQPELRKCTSRTTFVRKSCDFPAAAPAEAAADQGGIEPATATEPTWNRAKVTVTTFKYVGAGPGLQGWEVV